MLVSMGNRKVGSGTPVYIVFEAGPTHTGLDVAKKLADHAKSAGADAIKFQITDHRKLIQDRELLFNYKIIDKNGKIKSVTEPLFDIWERRYMPVEDWKNLKKYCDRIKLHFFATVFSKDDVDLVCEMGCDSLKIASQDTNYQDLIQYAAEKKIPIQLDTGGSSIGEVERAVDWILEKNNNQIIINHCPSGYPARLESINLNIIKTLKSMFEYPIAFSDHTPGWEMDVAAVSIGANIIEKTITLDRTQNSCEHMMSLEPHEMKRFVSVIRETEIALGSNRRIITPEERKIRKSTRRSAYLITNVKANDIIKREDFEFCRPGYGIKPDQYKKIIGKTYKKNLKKGQMLSDDDI
jgi:N,N'-diacetyllegionaminate synthase